MAGPDVVPLGGLDTIVGMVLDALTGELDALHAAHVKASHPLFTTADLEAIEALLTILDAVGPGFYEPLGGFLLGGVLAMIAKADCEPALYCIYELRVIWGWHFDRSPLVIAW